MNTALLTGDQELAQDRPLAQAAAVWRDLAAAI
jgi:hypothetical protein